MSTNTPTPAPTAESAAQPTTGPWEVHHDKLAWRFLVRDKEGLVIASLTYGFDATDRYAMEDSARLIADAGTVHAECGMGPRELLERVRELEGIKPTLPPFPLNEWTTPTRFGVRWNGPAEPLAVPMDDGYWTPWHLVDRERTTLSARVADLEAQRRERAPTHGDWVEQAKYDAVTGALSARVATLTEALAAQEAAELHRANCPDCMETTRDWTCCGLCSPHFGEAIDLRRAALKAGTAIDARYERTAFCLMEMMQAFERRIRSECKTTEELASRPWECSEWLRAADALKKAWPAYSAALKAGTP